MPTDDAPYHRLEGLPRGLWLWAAVAATGDAAARLESTTGWMHSLQRGEPPPAALHFGQAEASAALRRLCADLGLPALCRHVPALAEQVLRSVLWHLDSLIDRPAGHSQAQAIGIMAESFHAAWQRETAGVEPEPELQLLLGLGDFAQLSWDSLRGHLRSRPWSEARRAAQALAELPALQRLIRELGRAQRSTQAPPASTNTPEPAAPQRTPLRALHTTLTGVPGEITGITHGHQLAQMLPAEAMMLRHPVLRRLWRARYAEQRLLTWQTEAQLTDWRPDPHSPSRPQPASSRRETRDRGPIILCLDTSGSMQGAPERIAKAVVIAALQTARAEQRGCRLIAFGGPGELLDTDLPSGEQGLHALMALMGQSFDGGTDIQTPIERAVDTVHRERWRDADILIVSDGEFGCVPQTLDRLDDARQRLGLRVQGVLVGDRETMGLLEVCDHIHWEREWRRFADGEQGVDTRRFSPVHSRSLTALYFPNALSPRAARHHVAAEPTGSTPSLVSAATSVEGNPKAGTT
jgi:uncharacterized protein with von Willebrand factor type A (vWA) domain